MNVGIVSSWFERGAAYVSKQFEQVLEKEHDVFIYARGGEMYAIGDQKWDRENVTWGKNIRSRITLTLIDKIDFKKWIDANDIELILFNEQHWFQPLLWCKEWGIKTVAYIDYYTKETVDLFEVYDLLICNTKRHYSVFESTGKAKYLPWGTNIDLFKPSNDLSLVDKDVVTFFHSCGMGAKRKGTEQLLEAFCKSKVAQKLIIHTQKNITGEKSEKLIAQLINEGRLEIINKSVSAPGLFHLGDVYLYPTLLEGIGLTIAEAMSCGLAIVVPDNGPMNEFVEENIDGLLIKKGKSYPREDGYYWPLCEVDQKDFVSKIDFLATHKETVLSMKKKARENAVKKMNFDENMSSLPKMISEVDFVNLDHDVKEKITAFDNKGLGKINYLYIKFYFIIKALYKMYSLFKPSSKRKIN